MRFSELAIASLLVSALAFSAYTLVGSMSSFYGVANPIPVSQQIKYEEISDEEVNQTQSLASAMAGAVDRLISNIPVAGEIYSGIKTVGGYLSVVRRALDVTMVLFNQFEIQLTMIFGIPRYLFQLAHIAISIMVIWGLWTLIMNKSG